MKKTKNFLFLYPTRSCLYKIYPSPVNLSPIITGISKGLKIIMAIPEDNISKILLKTQYIIYIFWSKILQDSI